MKNYTLIKDNHIIAYMKRKINKRGIGKMNGAEKRSSAMSEL